MNGISLALAQVSGVTDVMTLVKESGLAGFLILALCVVWRQFQAQIKTQAQVASQIAQQTTVTRELLSTVAAHSTELKETASALSRAIEQQSTTLSKTIEVQSQLIERAMELQTQRQKEMMDRHETVTHEMRTEMMRSIEHIQGLCNQHLLSQRLSGAQTKREQR